MGLDMYLSARLHTSEYTEPETHALLLPIANKVLPPPGGYGAVVIQRDVAYWRKANQVHDWFVQNVQDGNDNCGNYSVDMEKLEELRDLCKKVVADPDQGPELLPTSGVFFGGSTAYDEHYIDDLNDTVTQLERVIDWCKAVTALSGKTYCSIDFEYQSSW